jgi:uncharacterized Zn finger protein (UPF0148 family)
MEVPDSKSSPSCPRCDETLIAGKQFCASCGLAVAPLVNMPEINAYVEAKVKNELDARLKDQSSMVRDISDQAEAVLWKRIRNYGIFVALIFSGIAWMGIKTIDDVAQKIVIGSEKRIEPLISTTESRAKAALADIDKTSKKVVLVQNTLMESQKLQMTSETAFQRKADL